MIDLTDPEYASRVAMITRYPPSESGSALSALDLARQLALRHGFAVEVIRLVLPGEPAAEGHPVVMDVNAQWHMCPRLAARRANRCDIAVLRLDRHVPIEFIEELLGELEVPVVLAVDELGPAETDASLAGPFNIADNIVAPSEMSRRRLSAMARDSIAIEVIPPGSPWRPLEPTDRIRRRILTWGYLAPGMGAERVIRSLARLRDLDPKPRYRLIGVTDPAWTRGEGDAYRAQLAIEAEKLGVRRQLDIVPILHSRRALEREIEKCDVIAVAYDSRDRASSRILAEAVSTARPVVATAFPGATEILSSGAGATVDHDDIDAMAGALRRYLTDDGEYMRAARAGAAMSTSLSMDETARKYASLLGRRLGEHPLTVNKA